MMNQLFRQSIEKDGVMYLRYGDGDSKSYQKVKSIYAGKIIETFECIGHYQKVNSRLANNAIDKLQNYFDIFLRSNVLNLKNMQDALLAPLGKKTCGRKNC